MSDNTAILAGYTREVIGCAHGGRDCHLFVLPAQDLRATFRAYDACACEWTLVDGWIYDFSEVA